MSKADLVQNVVISLKNGQILYFSGPCDTEKGISKEDIATVDVEPPTKLPEGCQWAPKPSK